MLPPAFFYLQNFQHSVMRLQNEVARLELFAQGLAFKFTDNLHRTCFERNNDKVILALHLKPGAQRNYAAVAHGNRKRPLGVVRNIEEHTAFDEINGRRLCGHLHGDFAIDIETRERAIIQRQCANRARSSGRQSGACKRANQAAASP